MSKRALAVAAGVLVGALGFAYPGLADNTAADHSHGSATKGCNDGTITWSPTTLWPPNHRMQAIAISYEDKDGDTDTVKLTVTAITHDQFLADGSEMVGSGNPHLIDTEGVNRSDTQPNGGPANVTVGVRAERAGKDQTGRTYSITLACNDYLASQNGVNVPDSTETDSQGNPNPDGMETVTITVDVPHDMGA